MKHLLLTCLLILSLQSYSQAPAKTSTFSGLKAITIDFKNFAKSEYAKLNLVSKKSSNETVAEKIEQLESETEAEIDQPWLKQKSLEIMDNVNVMNFIRNQYRWLLVNSKDDPELALDLVSQHIITHSLEVIGGPALTASYALNGGDPLIASIMGVASVVIAIPGLDPMCILGFMTYRYVPIYRTAFRAARMTLFMLPKFALKQMDAKERLSWLLEKEDRRNFVRKALVSKSLEVLSHSKVTEKNNNFKLVSNLDGSQVKMNFGYEASYKGLYLKHIEFIGDIETHSLSRIKSFSNELKQVFGWNVSQAVRQSLTRIRKKTIMGVASEEVLKATYYVENITSTDDYIKIDYFKDSIRSLGKNLFMKKVKAKCNKLFKRS